eukprot:scaffold31_cov263-Pinguiococcus_pyrenoidosus.AAC.12
MVIIRNLARPLADAEDFPHLAQVSPADRSSDLPLQHRQDELQLEVAKKLQYAMLVRAVEHQRVPDLDLREVLGDRGEKPAAAFRRVRAIEVELLLRGAVVAREEVAVGKTEGEARLADLDSLEDAGVRELLNGHGNLEHVGLLLMVRLDASDIVRLAPIHDGHEGLHPARVRVLGREHLPGQRVRSRGHHVVHVPVQAVLVLLHEPQAGVLHVASIMLDGKDVRALPTTRLLPVWIRGMLGGAFLNPPRIAALRQADLLVEKHHEAEGLLLDQVQNRLIVDEGDLGKADALRLVDTLLLLEGRPVEVLLQLLVREVDAELLEGVLLEDLEPEDVEHADKKGVVHLELHSVVDPENEPVEELPEDRLCERVRRLHRVRRLVQDVRVRAANVNGSRGEGAVDRLVGQAQQPRDVLHGLLAGPLDAAALVTIALELNVPDVQDRGHQREQPLHGILLEAEVAEAGQHLAEVVDVVHVPHSGASRLVQVPKPGRVAQSVLLALASLAQLVEDVKVPLARLLKGHAALLEEVVLDLAAADVAPRRLEVHLHPTPEAGAVVVPEGLGIAKGLQHRVGAENLLLDVVVRPRHLRQVGQALLRRLRLARTGLARNQDRLVARLDLHVREGVLRNREDVRLLDPVGPGLGELAHGLDGVDGQLLERVHADQHRVVRAHPGVDLVSRVALSKAVHHEALVQVVHHHQVLLQVVQRRLLQRPERLRLRLRQHLRPPVSELHLDATRRLPHDLGRRPRHLGTRPRLSAGPRFAAARPAISRLCVFASSPSDPTPTPTLQDPPASPCAS